MPEGNNVPEFWLADSTTASVRTIEELIITNSTVEPLKTDTPRDRPKCPY